MRPLRLILAVLLLAAALPVAAQPVPRTVLALYDGREEAKLRLSRIHTLAELPLNHLGLTVEYWNVADGLPDLARRPDVRGVITWFATEPFDDPRAYIDWVGAAIDRGVRFAVLGRVGARAARDGEAVPLAVVNRFLGRFGLRDDDGYSDLTFRSRPERLDREMIGFERPLGGALPGYPLLRKVDGHFASHLVMRRGGDPSTDSHLVVTGPTGGLVVGNYERYFDPETNRKLWIVNPFAFFRAVFDTDALPKPDVTTLSGRRIYFSHIDGDGWRNLTEVEPYAKKRTLSSEVVMREAIEAFPDLPVTVGPIGAEMDPDWTGTPQTMEIARRLLALPQVEPSSHTWTHPFEWSFFEHYTPQAEDAFGKPADAGPTSLFDRLTGRRAAEVHSTGGEGGAASRYAVPRAFAHQPFDLTREIGGSFGVVDALAPPGKIARLLQWSGDTSPFEGAVAAVRQAGAHNMNGGDTRLDAEYPSYTAVWPIGVPVGRERQIYAGLSNENTYTDLWTDRFFGFRNVLQTVRGTETPLRVKPFNVYYHMYSGQKLASLNALKKVLGEAREAEVAPVTATAYAAIAEGFYTARLVADGARRWRVLQRCALNTLRFDDAAFAGVDFARSAGVIGQRHHQGNLYVALDPAVAEPVVALAEVERTDVDPPAPQPYLVHGRWGLSGLTHAAGGVTAQAQGFGAGAMLWRVPSPGRYAVVAERDGRELWRGVAEAGADGRLAVTVAAAAETPLTLRLAPAGP